MHELSFKRLTSENWQEPDPTLSSFMYQSLEDGSIRSPLGDEWAETILAVALSDQVPLEVRQLFVVARASLIYGYFFYPLYTLGVEQLFRVADAAVQHKCRELGVLPETSLENLPFSNGVAHLVKQKAIPEAARPSWDALVKLRNVASHPKDQAILPPGIVLEELRHIGADIDGLFSV